MGTKKVYKPKGTAMLPKWWIKETPHQRRDCEEEEHTMRQEARVAALEGLRNKKTNSGRRVADAEVEPEKPKVPFKEREEEVPAKEKEEEVPVPVEDIPSEKGGSDTPPDATNEDDSTPMKDETERAHNVRESVADKEATEQQPAEKKGWWPFRSSKTEEAPVPAEAPEPVALGAAPVLGAKVGEVALGAAPVLGAKVGETEETTSAPNLGAPAPAPLPAPAADTPAPAPLPVAPAPVALGAPVLGAKVGEVSEGVGAPVPAPLPVAATETPAPAPLPDAPTRKSWAQIASKPGPAPIPAPAPAPMALPAATPIPAPAPAPVTLPAPVSADDTPPSPPPPPEEEVAEEEASDEEEDIPPPPEEEPENEETPLFLSDHTIEETIVEDQTIGGTTTHTFDEQTLGPSRHTYYTEELVDGNDSTNQFNDSFVEEEIGRNSIAAGRDSIYEEEVLEGSTNNFNDSFVEEEVITGPSRHSVYEEEIIEEGDDDDEEEIVEEEYVEE